MYKPRILLTNILKGHFSLIIKENNFCNSKNASKSIKINKCLVVSKMSRYEFESIRQRKLNVENPDRVLQKRGNYYAKLLYFHNLHKTFVEKVLTVLKNMNSEIKIVNRYTYSIENILWADVIFAIGGDGTFLLAASKMFDNIKPIVGFNSDPYRSEGHLCLPKEYSTDIGGAIERLKCGEFEWLNRNRIRTTLINHWDNNVKNLHEYEDFEKNRQLEQIVIKNNKKDLPILALNEVFIGEYMSAKVSRLEIRLDNMPVNTNIECCGLCICTGTGSSSWNMSINRIPSQSVAELIDMLCIKSKDNTETTAERIADIYNKSLLFPSDDMRMAYTVRDLITVGMQHRGFVTKITVKSHCQNAGLVIDGGLSFSFNDGNIAVLEINPTQALRTVVFKK